MAQPIDPFVADLTSDPEVLRLTEETRRKLDIWIDERVRGLEERHRARCDVAVIEVTAACQQLSNDINSRLETTFSEVRRNLAQLTPAVNSGNLSGIETSLGNAVTALQVAIDQQKANAREWSARAGSVLRTAILKI
jgi:hypothetical protein